MVGDCKDFIPRLIIQAFYVYIYIYIYIQIFVKINNGCSNFVESADWAQTTDDWNLPLGQITYLIVYAQISTTTFPKVWPSIEPDLNKITFKVQLKSSFKIILYISKVEHLQKKYKLEKVWSAIFNLAPSKYYSQSSLALIHCYFSWFYSNVKTSCPIIRILA